MSEPNKKLTDLSDVELEQLLTSKGKELAPITSDGNDHLLPFKDIPQPTKNDLESPSSAQDWAEQEIIRATPRAAQEMINQLRRGNSKERMEAAKQILDRAGLQSASRVKNQGPVIVLTPEAIAAIPWVKRAELPTKAEPKEVTGTVISRKAD